MFRAASVRKSRSRSLWRSAAMAAVFVAGLQGGMHWTPVAEAAGPAAARGDDEPQRRGKSKSPASVQKKAVRLPRYFSRLGLDDAQRDQVVSLQAEFAEREAKLREQLKDLESEREKALHGVLTRSQRAELKTLLEARASKKKAAPQSKKSTRK